MVESATQMTTGAERGQMLTFRLGAETYGVDILSVKEIRGWSPVTRIPESPTHMLGVLEICVAPSCPSLTSGCASNWKGSSIRR